MGGDNAPHAVLLGAERACQKYPNATFILYGNQETINPILENLCCLKKVCRVVHTDKIVPNDMKPSTALRQGQDSSMGLAVKSLVSKEADGAVSSGNTGALMAISKIALRTLPGIDRPAIASTFPNMKGRCIVLDLGANVECSAEHLFQFAVMGDAFAHAVLELENPLIGLLNIGSEEIKGNDAVKNASTMLKESNLNLNFYGHVEGDDIAKGTVDVVVSDGFTGNIALKTAEGTAQMCSSFLKKAYSSSIFSKIGYLLTKRSLKKVFNTLDPRLHNGAMFLGLNGIVVKSHGGTDEIGFANAIGVAIELVTHGINEQITKEIEQAHKQHGLQTEKVQQNEPTEVN